MKAITEQRMARPAKVGLIRLSLRLIRLIET